MTSFFGVNSSVNRGPLRAANIDPEPGDTDQHPMWEETMEGGSRSLPACEMTSSASCIFSSMAVINSCSSMAGGPSSSTKVGGGGSGEGFVPVWTTKRSKPSDWSVSRTWGLSPAETRAGKDVEPTVRNAVRGIGRERKEGESGLQSPL
jgi:hypothetical protein